MDPEMKKSWCHSVDEKKLWKKEDCGAESAF